MCEFCDELMSLIESVVAGRYRPDPMTIENLQEERKAVAAAMAKKVFMRYCAFGPVSEDDK